MARPSEARRDKGHDYTRTDYDDGRAVAAWKPRCQDDIGGMSVSEAFATLCTGR